MSGEFVEVTSSTMDPDDVQVYVGAPGTIARQLGPELICRRCFATRVALDHVCQDIPTGGRRWVRAGL